MATKPGTYTKDTLPPLSPGAEEILKRVEEKARLNPIDPAIKARLIDPKTGKIDPDVLGEALGARGDPRK